MGINFGQLLRVIGPAVRGTNISIKGRKIPLGQILEFWEANKEVLDSVIRTQPRIIVPAVDRPMVDGLPDDKIEVPIFKPTPAPVPPSPAPRDRAGYTRLNINVAKAQYNRELFPEQYTGPDGDNVFGLYRPARVPVYNRRSKIWFNVTPYKGSHGVETEEGREDGILWGIVWHALYRGQETILKADPVITHDTHNGSERPIQVVEGESVGFGLEAWDAAHSFLAQIQVGDNEGPYAIYAEHPKLGLRSDTIEFEVS